ncbi:hypothetical protein [Saccharopolyspora phatthalungensis]|uniref:Uncharacterized protein n=1 Tax=Saccharopolyspora phatthalungensis TaxID=664693 RepID=A0A840QBT4_9PSEU|nr:hypothetical protein [Saccharopolyspora phatthalungensis]MBB5157407.1 hypothetical protein [Saccharopolyspora phatthalungensis]
MIPDAQAHDQRELETAVLAALTRGMDHLVFHSRAWDYRVGRVIKSVRPEPDSVSLELDPLILGPMLGELLPIGPHKDEQSIEIAGTAGARARWRKSGQLVISLADPASHAEVIVTGVGKREWHAAQVYVRAERPLALTLNDRYQDVLSPNEADFLLIYPRFHLPIHFVSGLLRRVKIFSTAWALSIHGSRESAKLSWSGALTVESALTALCHPVTQITPNTFTATEWPVSQEGEINDLNTADRSASRRTTGCSLILRGDPETQQRPRVSQPGSMPNYWQAWETAYAGHPQKHRSSQRLSDLVELRRANTGEEPSRAKNCIGPLANETDERELRNSLIPEAHSLHQRVLETSLLLAIRDGAVLVSDFRHRFHQVFLSVSPRKERLVAELNPAVSNPFFKALLANEEPSPSGDGVPGLRLESGQNGIDLRLLDETGTLTDAKLEIKNINLDDWDKIWNDINRTVEHEYRRVDPLLDRSPQLSRGERDGMTHQRKRCGPVGLGSAMLRRIGLLAGARAVDVWPGLGKTQIHVEIDSGPSISSIVSALQHPIAGVTNYAEVLDENQTRFAQLREIQPTADRFVGPTSDAASPPALILRPLTRQAARRRNS